MEERLQQLNYETHEVAETERKLESDLKKPMASVKAKEHNIGFIQQEQNAALRNLKNSKGLFKMNAMRFFPLLDIPMKPKELLL
jgi:ATP-dependent exoDNAse (exonuclease V) alpha subunit